jgi:hypothetical protein
MRTFARGLSSISANSSTRHQLRLGTGAVAADAEWVGTIDAQFISGHIIILLVGADFG